VSSSGCPPIVDVDKITDILTKDSVGIITSITDICHILEAEARKAAEVKAGCSLSHITISAQTVRNYKSFTWQIVKYVQQKTDNQHTVGNSIMSTVCF